MALLDEDICYRALRTRDARFDGRFFVGVRTTGIYCRPICPARPPLRKNLLFFSCAAAAEAAGFPRSHRKEAGHSRSGRCPSGAGPPWLPAQRAILGMQF